MTLSDGSSLLFHAGIMGVPLVDGMETASLARNSGETTVVNRSSLTLCIL